jgi:hypothetical protein
MTLSAGNTIETGDLNDPVTDRYAAMNAEEADGRWGLPITVAVPVMTTSIAEHIRSVTFTPPDDLEVVALVVHHNASTTSSTTSTAALTQADGGTKFMLGKTVSLSVTTTATGNAYTTQDYSASNADGRLFLVKGVQYNLTLTNTGANVGRRATAILYVRGRVRRS